MDRQHHPPFHLCRRPRIAVGVELRDSRGAERDANSDRKVPKPWVIDRLQIKNDDEGYLDRRREHLYVFTLENEELRQITFGDCEDPDPAWSPDVRWIEWFDKYLKAK